MNPPMPSLDFHKSRMSLVVQGFDGNCDNLRSLVRGLEVEDGEEILLEQIKGVVRKLDTKDTKEVGNLISMLKGLMAKVHLKEIPKLAIPQRIPADIHDEIGADLDEISRCMHAACYRSVVILCGRVIEVVLHRKYYEATNNDLLEKSPGNKAVKDPAKKPLIKLIKYLLGNFKPFETI